LFVILPWLGSLPVILAVGTLCTPNAALAGLPGVTNVSQFLELSGKLANQGCPVHFEGVVVYADPVKNEVMFKDDTGTTPVSVDLRAHPVQPGQYVALEGATGAKLVRYPDYPSGSQLLTSFEAPVNIGEHFVARVRGYLYPPQTGEYSFWVAADDQAELWLSSDENPENAQRITRPFRFTAPRQWDKAAGQHSVGIKLIAGKRYYIEAFHLQTSGEDCLAVAWAGPGMPQAVIDGGFLSPWDEGRSTPPARGTITREFWLNYPSTKDVRFTGAWRTNPPTIFGQTFITASEFCVLHDQWLMPVAKRISAEEMLPPEMDFQWAEAEGVITHATDDGAYWSILELTDGERRLNLRVTNPAREKISGLLNARVRVRGFCQGSFNHRGDRVAALLWVSSLKEIEVVEPQAEDWLRLTPIPFSQLMSSNSPAREGEIIRVQGRVMEQNPGHTLTLRTSISRFTAWVSRDGSDWIQVGDPLEIPMNNSIYAGLAIASRSTNRTCTAIAEHVSGLSGDWTNADIGNPPLAGAAEFRGGTCNLMGSGGSGRGLAEKADQFHYVYQPLESDGEIVARMASVQGGDNTFANAGVMMRETLNPDAKSVSLDLRALRSAGLELRVRRGTGNPDTSTPCGSQGQYWMKLVRRSSDQLQVQSSQNTALDPNAAIEVMGVLEQTNGSWSIDQAFYRAVAVASNAPDVNPIRPRLTRSLTVQEVRQLSAEELAQGYQVIIRGVVTSKTDDLYVQDGTAGIRIPYLQSQKFSHCAAGEFIEVSGSCAAGDYSPVVFPDEHKAIAILGPGTLPEAQPKTWMQLMTGAEDAQWVEVKGVVRAVAGRSLKFQMRGGVITAALDFDYPPDFARRLVNATVQVQGVCKVIANERKQLVGFTLLVPSFECVSVVQAPPEDPFGGQAYAVNDLLKFDPQQELCYRVKLQGTVTCQSGRSFFMQDATGGLRVEALDDVALHGGDQVQVVGFAEAGGFSPVLSEALVRKSGAGAVPRPVRAPMSDLLKGAHDAQWVQVEGVFLGGKTAGTAQVLEFQSGGEVFRTLLPADQRLDDTIPVGSRVNITGVFKADNANVTESGQLVSSFQIHLAAINGLAILERPSWWTMQRLLAGGGFMIVALGATLFWIRTLRGQVEAKTQALKEKTQALEVNAQALKEEIEEHKRTETILEYEIAESKRKEQIIERTHQELMVASRQAGQAEVASSVLHNVGNVLNSVNVASGLIADHLGRLHITGLTKAVKLLREQTDLGVFFKEDPRGPQFLSYLEQWSSHFDGEKSSLLSEVRDLEENVGHIKEIVAMHQNYTKVSGLTEKLAVAEVIENAVKMHSSSLAERSIALEREYEAVPLVLVDKHKFLQIMGNLLLNAKQACDEAEEPDKQIVIRIKALEKQRIGIEVADNGVGIPQENLTRIFAQGFTTRKEGHGFGLHSAALAAKEMNGKLQAYSDGVGLGAVFVLELPVAPMDERELVTE
jgi:signal transduction histidine kinase/uncharacterized protein YdeI (BOF family)